jgi:hypothetical protein
MQAGGERARAGWCFTLDDGGRATGIVDGRRRGPGSRGWCAVKSAYNDATTNVNSIEPHQDIRTIELGGRGCVADGTEWRASRFRSWPNSCSASATFWRGRQLRRHLGTVVGKIRKKNQTATTASDNNKIFIAFLPRWRGTCGQGRRQRSAVGHYRDAEGPGSSIVCPLTDEDWPFRTT